MSQTLIPIPREVTLLLSASIKKWPADYIVTDGMGGPAQPWHIERALRAVHASGRVEALPDGFSFHDLRHNFASLLISKKSDLKTAQAWLRHARAKTTPDTYGHMWPDADESTRSAIDAVITKRVDSSEDAADAVRTEG